MCQKKAFLMFVSIFVWTFFKNVFWVAQKIAENTISTRIKLILGIDNEKSIKNSKIHKAYVEREFVW